MANSKEFFLLITQRIFSNWTALRMAVQHGNGSKERAMDLCPYMTEILYLNDQLHANEIAGELEDYMDNYFNTELADNSAIQVAEDLLRFYEYCIKGNEALAQIEFNKLPPLQSWIQPHVQITKVKQAVDSSSESDDQMESEEVEATDPGWTVVKTRRNR